MIEGLFHIYDLKLLHKLFSLPKMLIFHESREYMYEITYQPYLLFIIEQVLLFFQNYFYRLSVTT